MIRAFFFFVVLFVTTVTGALIVIFISIFQKYSRFSYQYIVRSWAKILLWVAGTRVIVRGREHISESHPYIVVSNHQSHMDIPVLIAHLPLRMTILAKKELFRIPIFAQGMHAVGILKIDRSDHSRALATLKQAEEVIKQYNISLLAFPEGTRSRDGNMRPFKKGPFVMAINSGLEILPVSISGTFPILPKGRFLVRPGEVTVTIHPPVSAQAYRLEDRNQLINDVYQTIAAGLYQYVETA